MSEDVERLEIRCPICDETHEFPVFIKKSVIIYNMTANMDTSPKSKTFRRTFTCPKKNETFKAVLTLTEHFGETIDDVEPQ